MGGNAGEAPAIAQGEGAQLSLVFVKAAGILIAGIVIHRHFDVRAGFGFDQFEFAHIRRHPVFLAPNLHEQEFMAKIGNVL